jgi:hypothetical protein
MLRLFKTIVSAAEVTAWSRWEGNREELQFVSRYFDVWAIYITIEECHLC